MNWNQLTDLDIYAFLDLYDDEELTLLHVEDYAEAHGMMSCEAQVSEAFDENVLPYVLETYGDDNIAISEAFNDWTDILCKDGELHPLQYDAYCYVGRLARY